MTPNCSVLYTVTFLCQVVQEEKTEREEAKKKREQAVLLESQKGQPVNDSELMNRMFGFLDEEGAPGDGRTTDAFGKLFC